MSKNTVLLPDWELVLSSAARLQRILPDAVTVNRRYNSCRFSLPTRCPTTWKKLNSASTRTSIRAGMTGRLSKPLARILRPSSLIGCAIWAWIVLQQLIDAVLVYFSEVLYIIQARISGFLAFSGLFSYIGLVPSPDRAAKCGFCDVHHKTGAFCAIESAPDIPAVIPVGRRIAMEIL